MQGHVDVVRVLLEGGADIDKAIDDGATPLFIASQQGHVEVVRALVEGGADIDKARDGGYSLREGTCRRGEGAA